MRDGVKKTGAMERRPSEPRRVYPSLLTLTVLGACGLGACARWNSLEVDPNANVLLITLDTTRADRIGAYGYRQIETPTLDALAREGVLFNQAIAPTPLTLPAHTSVMTGVYPNQHGVRDNGGFFLGDQWQTLAEILRARGYRTFAAVGAFVLHHLWGLAQGFEEYDDHFDATGTAPSDMLHTHRDGSKVVESAIRWWDQHPGERFFVWLHFYDPHHPYELKGEFAERYRDRPYDGEIAYTDSLVGKVIEYLKKRGVYDKTLVVVVGDHGEGLGDHREPDHGVFLYQSTLRVPLIIRSVGARYRGTVDQVVREIDIMPTILAYLGAPCPKSVRGRSLLPLMAGRRDLSANDAYSEAYYSRFHYGWSDLHSLTEARYKFIEAPKAELYDLEQDPGETRNVIDLYPDVSERMRSKLKALTDEGTAGVEEPAAENLDPDTLGKLASLGYVGSRAPASQGPLPDPKDKLEEMNLLIFASRESAKLLESGRFQEVIRMLEGALRKEPNYMDGYLNLASAHLQLNQPDRAIEILDKAIRLTPDNVNMMNGLAKCYVKKKDYRTAIGLYKTIISRSPRFAQAYFGLSDAYVEREQYDDAIETLGALLMVHPNTPMALYEIGLVHLRKGDVKAATTRIQEALKSAPRLRDAHFNLGLIAEQEGNAPLARTEYEKEVELFPRNLEARTNLGIVCMDMKAFDCATESFRELISEKPDFPPAHYLLARTYFMEGRRDEEVVRLAQRAVELEPSFMKAREFLAGLLDARRRG